MAIYGILVPTGGGDDIRLRNKELILGRSESCDIVLRFQNVSSKHCRLTLNLGYWYAVDMASTNGIFLNNARIYDHRIDPGEIISFAGHSYYLRYDPVANGAQGIVPPQFLEQDILSKSLLERAGLSKKMAFRPKKKTEQPPIDYEALTLDDIKFE